MRKIMAHGHPGEGFNGLTNGDLILIQRSEYIQDLVEFWEAGSMIDCGYDISAVKGETGEEKLLEMIKNGENYELECVVDKTGFYNFRYEGDVRLCWYCSEDEYTEWWQLKAIDDTFYADGDDKDDDKNTDSEIKMEEN